METLVEVLSQFTPEDIDTIARLAKEAGTKNRKQNVPVELVERFKEAYKKFDAGQEFTFRFNLPIKIELKIRADHEFGHVTDWRLEHPTNELSELDKKLVEWFEKEFKEALNYALVDNPWALERISPEVLEACNQETENYKKYMQLRHTINQYGVEALELL